MNALYRFFKSIRLAVVLILLITALSLLSTLVPQGREPGFYQSEYPALYGIIRAIAFDRFFNSLLFLVPIGLFAANLGVCSVDRFVRRTHTKAQKRYGPDLVHIGLLLLMAAGLVTALARQEKDFTMTAGEQMELTASYSIRLVSLEFLKYENGTPKAWISTVDVLHNGNKEMASVPIKVNSPLRLKGVTVFQTSWQDEALLVAKDGREGTIQPGAYFQDGKSIWYFARVVDEGGVRTALFQEYNNAREIVSMRKIGISDSIGPYTMRELREFTGLRAVNDPGYLPLMVAFVVLAAGFSLTFIQRRKGETAR